MPLSTFLDNRIACVLIPLHFRPPDTPVAGVKRKLMFPLLWSVNSYLAPFQVTPLLVGCATTSFRPCPFLPGQHKFLYDTVNFLISRPCGLLSRLPTDPLPPYRPWRRSGLRNPARSWYAAHLFPWRALPRRVGSEWVAWKNIMRICNIWQVLFCIYAIKRVQKIHAGVPALIASWLMGAKMPLRRGAGGTMMGGAAGNYEYLPMTEEEEALHRKMLRRQKLLGITIPPNHFMTSYEWEALNGWHGKKEFLRYRRSKCIISWILFLTMLSFVFGATYYVFSLLSFPAKIESPMPLQDQEQKTDMQ